MVWRVLAAASAIPKKTEATMAPTGCIPLMAAAAIVVLPMIVLFICFRKQIVTGVSRGGLKG